MATKTKITLLLALPLTIVACGDSNPEPGESSNSTVAAQERNDDVEPAKVPSLPFGPAGMPGISGMSGLRDMIKSAESAKAIAELQEKAEGQMMTDPARAVATLATAAELSAKAGGMQASMHAMSIQALESVLASYPDPERYLQLGRSQFLVGRFSEAKTSLAAALENGLADPTQLVHAHCWAGASAQALGESELARQAIESARGVLADRAKAAAARANAPQPQRRVARRNISSDGLPPPNPYSWSGIVPGSDPGRPSSGGMGGTAGAGGGTVAQEYYAAKQAYDAEQARYDSEVRLANSRAGRFGAQGIQINPRQVDQQVYMRYLNAKAAYDASRGRR